MVAEEEKANFIIDSQKHNADHQCDQDLSDIGRVSNCQSNRDIPYSAPPIDEDFISTHLVTHSLQANSIGYRLSHRARPPLDAIAGA